MASAVRGFVLACLFAITGCAGEPHGVLVPLSASVPGASRVDMLVATTRDLDRQDPTEMFDGDRAAAMSFAAMSVSIPPDQNRVAGEIQWPKSVPGDPEHDFVTLRADIIQRAEAVKEFHTDIQRTPRRQVLVFVHGYNTRYKDAVFRFAQIVHDSGTQAMPVLFTWPSRAKFLAYGYDRESTNYSRDALELTLTALVKDPGVKDVTILAHSMGNWLTLETLRQMAIRDGRVPAKISNVMLAAPDVDVDVFRTQINTIGRRAPRFTLFVSQDDKALALSRRLALNPRLGSINPNAEPYRTELSADHINVIDLTKVTSADASDHSKFAESPEVVQLIGQRLASGQEITDDRLTPGQKLAGMTSSVATGASSVAGLAFSAPIAIFDADTRAGLGDQIDQIGGNLNQDK